VVKGKINKIDMSNSTQSSRQPPPSTRPSILDKLFDSENAMFLGAVALCLLLALALVAMFLQVHQMKETSRNVNRVSRRIQQQNRILIDLYPHATPLLPPATTSFFNGSEAPPPYNGSNQLEPVHRRFVAGETPETFLMGNLSTDV